MLTEINEIEESWENGKEKEEEKDAAGDSEERAELPGSYDSHQSPDKGE